jgi:hypothetical protein
METICILVGGVTVPFGAPTIFVSHDILYKSYIILETNSMGYRTRRTFPKRFEANILNEMVFIMPPKELLL